MSPTVFNKRERIDQEILDVRLGLTHTMTRARRIVMEGELRDLKLARVGLRTPGIRARLARLGIEGPQPTLRRGPNEWGEATRVQSR